MPPAKRKVIRPAARVRYTNPLRKGPGAQTSQRRVFGAGVPGGTVHLVATRGEDGTDERTLCGNWPGRYADMSADRLCPICFKEQQ